jgi:hypothetical protein
MYVVTFKNVKMDDALVVSSVVVYSYMSYHQSIHLASYVCSWNYLTSLCVKNVSQNFLFIY